MTYRSVYCIAPSPSQARAVIRRLQEIEFPDTEISALFLAPKEKPAAPPRAPAAKEPRENKPASPSAAILGSKTLARTVLVPAAGSLIATGPVAAILDDAVTYGIAGGLREFGVPASEALRYEARIKQAQVFLSIRTENPDKSDLVRGIFTAEGGEDIRTLMDVLTPKVARRSLYGPARVAVG